MEFFAKKLNRKKPLTFSQNASSQSLERVLTLKCQRSLSYTNQSIHLFCNGFYMIQTSVMKKLSAPLICVHLILLIKCFVSYHKSKTHSKSCQTSKLERSKHSILDFDRVLNTPLLMQYQGSSIQKFGFQIYTHYVKSPYSELFWSVFSRIRSEYVSPNAGKYGPE